MLLVHVALSTLREYIDFFATWNDNAEFDVLSERKNKRVLFLFILWRQSISRIDNKLKCKKV